MDTNAHTLEIIEGAEAADMLLADLDMDPEINDGPDEILLAGIGESHADEEAVEVAVEIAAAYDEQEVVVSDVATVETIASVAGEKPKKPRKAKEAAAPKTPKDLESIDAKVFVLTADTPADLEANKAAVIASRPAQKKIGEKFDNLFQSLSVGKKPSTYVMQCFGVLDEKGSATATEIVAALKATASRKGSPYDQGTAMSQVGQMMVLFHTVGIAVRTTQTLTIDRNSPITKKLKALAAS